MNLRLNPNLHSARKWCKREFSFKFRAKRDKANQILTQLPKSPFTEKKHA